MSATLSFQRSLGYSFRRPELLNRALSHSSVNPDYTFNSSHLEFIGSSSLYLGLLHQVLLVAPASIRGWELINLVDQMISDPTIFRNILEAIGIERYWQVDNAIENDSVEKLWLVYAICGALIQDSGYQAIQPLVNLFIKNYKLPFSTPAPIETKLPWGPWTHRITINLDLINYVFPRHFTNSSLRLLPWALETHIRPGVYNQRSSQIFELGEAALRWRIDLKLFNENLLEPRENRFIQRQQILSRLGLENRQDQAYSSCFAGQDWRRQSLDHRIHSLKNLLGAIFITDSGPIVSDFADIILNKTGIRESPRSYSSVVVSSAA